MLHGEHSAILLTFIKLPIVTKIFVLSVLERPFYTSFYCNFILKQLEVNIFPVINVKIYMPVIDAF